eukprot:TRINITY_DN1520_c0_g1_i1.p1 TRINITY_DN1520_c0_g1~~TRINITY_DN1520_c0_g1_i1.p1  ORF type:complete len:794 (+),score=160.36 TRINITY_DN1520_c0_g1_i1:53-2383(+)
MTSTGNSLRESTSVSGSNLVFPPAYSSSADISARSRWNKPQPGHVPIDREGLGVGRYSQLESLLRRASATLQLAANVTGANAADIYATVEEEDVNPRRVPSPAPFPQIPSRRRWSRPVNPVLPTVQSSAESITAAFEEELTVEPRQEHHPRQHQQELHDAIPQQPIAQPQQHDNESLPMFQDAVTVLAQQQSEYRQRMRSRWQQAQQAMPQQVERDDRPQRDADISGAVEIPVAAPEPLVPMVSAGTTATAVPSAASAASVAATVLITAAARPPVQQTGVRRRSVQDCVERTLAAFGGSLDSVLTPPRQPNRQQPSDQPRLDIVRPARSRRVQEHEEQQLAAFGGSLSDVLQAPPGIQRTTQQREQQRPSDIVPGPVPQRRARSTVDEWGGSLQQTLDTAPLVYQSRNVPSRAPSLQQQPPQEEYELESAEVAVSVVARRRARATAEEWGGGLGDVLVAPRDAEMTRQPHIRQPSQQQQRSRPHTQPDTAVSTAARQQSQLQLLRQTRARQRQQLPAYDTGDGVYDDAFADVTFADPPPQQTQQRVRSRPIVTSQHHVLNPPPPPAPSLPPPAPAVPSAHRYPLNDDDDLGLVSDNGPAFQHPVTRTRLPQPHPTETVSVSRHHGSPMCTCCQETLLLGEVVQRLPCRHLFHNRCISQWLRGHRDCPNCRRDIYAPIEQPLPPRQTTVRQLRQPRRTAAPAVASAVSEDNYKVDSVVFQPDTHITCTDCSICLEGYRAGEQVLQLRCKHLFHPQCAGEWLHRNPRCPNCRANVVPD